MCAMTNYMFVMTARHHTDGARAATAAARRAAFITEGLNVCVRECVPQMNEACGTRHVPKSVECGCHVCVSV